MGQNTKALGKMMSVMGMVRSLGKMVLIIVGNTSLDRNRDKVDF